MEKHHKLRRPAGSSIHGCNICGIEGHQAAHCPNGSGTNWAEKFGPAWTVDLDALRHKEPDYDALAARARAYAESRAKGEAGTSGGGESAKNESAGNPAAAAGGAPRLFESQRALDVEPTTPRAQTALGSEPGSRSAGITPDGSFRRGRPPSHRRTPSGSRDAAAPATPVTPPGTLSPSAAPFDFNRRASSSRGEPEKTRENDAKTTRRDALVRAPEPRRSPEPFALSSSLAASIEHMRGASALSPADRAFAAAATRRAVPDHAAGVSTAVASGSGSVVRRTSTSTKIAM
uniref:CCHC-type domain-containing protein n=1 Tax=Micromonas pusilla TaxID=38833 RepID=A0A7S0GPK7_MICPS|mmetsp:Transcript_12448/g.53391  ORF Transcript_12448/g.53391 Transcript_12448/m.53391 type:complete len:290 (+) Transcript_12448:96-965(+)